MRAMKDSGVAWIGEIPKEWDVRPIKNSFAVVSGATPKSDITDYWDGNVVWVTPADYKFEDKYVFSGKRNLTQAGYASCGTTLVPSGSIVFSKRAPIGTVAITGCSLCTNQGCLSCIPKPGVSALFFYYTMAVFSEQFNLYGTGTIFKEISFTDFSNFTLPLPSYEEQTLIAAFLDTECARIDAVIAQTRASIEEYKKLKQSVITQAVTKGIRPNRPMKDSGVEWIDCIPVEWTMGRGKGLFIGVDNRSEDGSEELLTVSQYTGITPRSQKNVTMFEAETLEGYKICEIGDIAANTMWLWAGAIGVSRFKGVISPSYNIYRQKSGSYAPAYLDYLLRTTPLVQHYESLSTGIRASRLRLYPQQFLSIRFPVPPLDEQKEIVCYLKEKVDKMDLLIRKKELFLSEIELYKNSMIYEYVTGKKEVFA